MSDETDPFGDKAYLEERRKRGRGAILDDAEDWTPPPPPSRRKDEAGGDDEPDDEEDGPPGEPVFDHVRIPRFFGKSVRMVPISMPDDAPITCLGKLKRTYFYLTPNGELVELTDAEHGQAHIESLWSPKLNLLHRAFPQFDQQQKFKGFQAQYARAAMFAACGNKPLFDAHERVRGLGCWRGEDGELVQHLGDEILIGAQKPGEGVKPGEVGSYVYPGRTILPRPKAGGLADCEAIYRRMQMWNFARGEVDARLLLGQVAAGVLGAAIGWRPMAFMTGDAGTGKSSLQQLVRALLPGRMISTVDASEAALRALLGQDALAVSFDEIEADHHSDKAQAVMKLARTSASGDNAYRSGSDQVARSFTLRGSFLFSAIIPPSMRQQDMQRFAFLRLKTLPDGAALPPITDKALKDLGCGLVGRITEGWPRWERTLDAYFKALQQRGHEHRGAMQFGTMLAAAHLLLKDTDPDVDDLADWCEPLKRDGLFEYENSEPAWLQAWRIIMTAQPEAWRGEGSPSVAEMVRRYLVARSADQGDAETKKCHDKLTRAGLAIVHQRATGRLFLAIAHSHSGIAGIFRGTDFEKKGGGGAWNIPLRGAPEVEGETGVLRVDNVPRLERQKCAMFWLDGSAKVAGEIVRIFDRQSSEDETGTSDSDRVHLYAKAMETAPDLEQLGKVREKGVALREQLEKADPAELERLESLFNARWQVLEG